MDYFEKLHLQSVVYNELGRRYKKLEYLYKIGFSYDEVSKMGFTRKRK